MPATSKVYVKDLDMDSDDISIQKRELEEEKAETQMKLYQ